MRSRRKMPFTGHYTFTLLQINVYLSNVTQCIHRAVRPAAPNQTKRHEKNPACSNLRNGPDLLLQYTGDSGNVEKSEPLIEVSREWNHQLIYGLVPLNNATMKATEYVGDRENYVVRTYSSFLNGLVGSLTFGIYTPTSTVYYVPLKDIAPTHSVDVRNNEIIDLIEE